ncbi:hypothetical protein LAM01_05990 [Amylolactobacillus amylophilus]|nr:hypothetical protein LAM01_05990 [Amylolactobacillus amylophilus]
MNIASKTGTQRLCVERYDHASKPPISSSLIKINGILEKFSKAKISAEKITPMMALISVF